MKKIITTLGMAALITGCASQTHMQDLQKDQMKAEKMQAEYQQDKQDARQEKMENYLDKLPAWVTEPPKQDATGIYAVGIAKSTDMATSMKKARLEAEFQLAQQISQTLAGNERAITQDSNDGGVQSHYDQLIDRFVKGVPLKGHDIVEQKVLPIEGQYQTFILMKITHKNVASMLEKERGKWNDQDLEKAFNRLYARVDKANADEAKR